MVTEIDDSAWGLPLFGVWLGFHHIESGRIIVKEVGVDFFQGNNFSSKKYLDECVKQAKIALLHDLKIPATEELRICSGFVLSKIYEWAIDTGFRCKKTKITGKLQSVMEETSRTYIASLPGFKKEKSESLYDALIKWIGEDPEKRLIYVKTGWNAIKKIFQGELL